VKAISEYNFSFYFRKKVEPEKLGIPDYFDIVKRPMDLSTVSRRLKTNVYSSDLVEFISDMRQIFMNAVSLIY